MTQAALGYVDDERVQVSPAVWNTVVPRMRRGDSVVLVYKQGTTDPLFVTKVTGGNTLKALFSSIERGMHTPIPESQAADAYTRIGLFPRKSRILYSKKMEQGSLCPVDLVGDHEFYEGNLQRVKGVWIYALGS